MFLKSKRLQKVLAALAITGLMSFGATSVQADVAFESNIDLTAIDGAAVSSNFVDDENVCVNFSGLGASQSVDLTGLSLTAYIDAEVAHQMSVANSNIQSESDGVGGFCFSNYEGGNADEFSPFLGYTKVVVEGTATIANINFSQSVDLSAIDGASYQNFSGGNEVLCVNYQGLGASKRIVLKDLVLKGFVDETEAVSVDLPDQNVYTDAEGYGGLCAYSTQGNDAENFDGFSTYTSVTLSGTAIEPIMPTVIATYDYATGPTATATASAEFDAESMCVSIQNLPARAELTISGASLTANKSLEGETTVSLGDQGNFAASEQGFGYFCWYSYDGSELYPLGDLGAYLNFEIILDVQVDTALVLGEVAVSASIDSTLFPELEITEKTPYIDPHVICFKFGGGPISTDLRLGDIEITLTKGSALSDSGVEKSTMVSTDDQGNFDYCLSSTVADVTGLGNLTSYDTIEFSASLTVASEWSDVLSRYLATRGLTLKDKWFYYDGETDRTNVSITVANEGETRLAYNVLGFQWEDRDLIGYDKFWLIGAGEEAYMNLGYVTGDATQGDPSVDVWTLLKAATPSVFNTSRLRLPAGIVVAGDALDWRYNPSSYEAYFADKTILGLVLENTTDEPITIKAPLTWKVGNSTIKTTGFEVGTIEAHSKIFVQGNLGNDLRVKGDIRQGNTVSISGTISKVTPNTVDTADFNVPDGVDVVRFDYSFVPGDKRTEVYATFYNECAPENVDSRDDLFAGAVFVGTSTKSNGLYPIATGWCSESGVSRQTLIAYLPGDQRSGKSLKFSTNWSFSQANEWPNSEAVVLTRYTNDVGCFVTGGSEWLFETNLTDGKTNVTVVCYNWGTSTAKIDLSGLTGSYLNEEEVPVVMAKLSGVNKIKLGVGQYKTFKVLTTPGEIRTGGYATSFAGTIKISKY